MIRNGKLKQTIELATEAEESVKNMSADRIREGLVTIKLLQKDLEKSYKLLEEEALKRNLADKMLLEHSMKFQIKLGNEKTEYNIHKIGTLLPIQQFVKIVNIIDSKAKEILTEKEYKIVEDNKQKISSDKFLVSISKMTKQELIEATIK